MKIFKFFGALALSAVLISTDIHTHGFVAETLIRLQTGWMAIDQLARSSADKSECTFLPCCDEHDVRVSLYQPIERVGFSETDHIVSIVLDDEQKTAINCAPLQPFYSTTRDAWVPAYQITPSDTLLCQYGKTIGVRDIFWYSKVTPIHAFQVKDAHTYFVTHHSVLAHNYAMVLQGLQAIEWVIGTGLVLLVELEQARQGFLAELAVQEAAKKAAQKTAEKVAEKVVEQASKKVLGKTVEIAVTKAPVIAQQTTTAVTTATQATTALKQAASVKQVMVHTQQATAVLQAPAKQAATQALGGITLGTALNIATALYIGYKLHRYYQDNYAYQCIYKKFQYNASQLAQVIEMTRLQASQEQVRALKQQIDTAIEEWEAECQRQAEAEKLARQQENERRIKQEEERKRVQQLKLEKLFEDTSSKWEIINQELVGTAAVLKEAEPTYLARDKYSDKKKRLKEEKKKKKGGGNGNNDDDPDDPKDEMDAILWLGRRLKNTLEDMRKKSQLSPKYEKLLDYLPKSVKKENIQGNWYHPPTARGNVMGGKSPGPLYSQLEEIVENAVPSVEPSNDKFQWLSTSRQTLYRIMDSRNGHYHVHQAGDRELTSYAKKLLKEMGRMCSKEKII